MIYDVDPRRIDIFASEMGLDHAKPLSSPATKIDADVEGDEHLAVECSTAFRSIAARATRSEWDRPDIQCVCKEVSSAMASPKQCGWPRLRRSAK